MSRTHALFDRLLRRPGLTSLPAVLLTLAALPVVSGIEIDNTLEVWLDRESDAYREYQDFRRTFGSEEFILVIYPCPEPVELTFLERLTDLRFELEEIEGVRRVYDLARVYSQLYSLSGIDAFRADLHGSAFLSRFLISPDGKLAATWIYLDLESPAARGRVVAAVEEALLRAPPGEAVVASQVHLAGSPVLNAALDRSSQTAARTFLPFVFLLSAFVLLLLFRRVSAVVIPFVSVGAGIAWTLAVLKLSGHSLNMVTVTLPPLVWVLGLSTSIHLLSRWHGALAAGETHRDALGITLRELFRPCLMSAVTTAIGFASLLASSMRPAREMGVFAAMGILFCFASNFLLFPALTGLRMRISKRLPWSRRDHPVLDAVVRLDRRPRVLLLLAAAFGVAFAAGIPRLTAESNPIRFFRDDAPIAATYERVLPGFTGMYSLELTLEAPEVDKVVLARLDELQGFLESRDGVARALSVADLVKRAHQELSGGEYRLPETAADFEDAWERVADHPDELEAFMTAGTLRVSALAQPMGSSAHQRLLADVAAYLEREVGEVWKVRLTGIVPLLVAMQEDLVDSQVRTFALAFLMIMLVLGLLLGKASYVLVSLGPNLLPVVFAFGTMGWLAIPLDPATVMIAGIALGIAVNDTIHFLERFRVERRGGRATEEAVRETLHVVGRPMVITSLVTALGFLVLCFSDFVPLLNFGLLTAVTMGAALVGDLMVLPALLLRAAQGD